MGDSFDPPSGNFNLNASGQRVWIADYSGLPIETQLFGGERFVKAWISGQPVQSSVSLSGLTLSSNVSGNIVYLTSGQNNVQMSGQTVYLASGFNEIAGSFTANVSGQPVNVSGNTVIALISGQTVVANVTTNISGQTVYLASGQNNVQMSGQTVVVPFTSISGNVIVVPSTSVSGNLVTISGNIVNTSGQVAIISGQPVSVSGNVVEPISGGSVRLHGLDLSGNQWLPLATSASGKNRLAIAIYDVSNANSVTVGSAADNESNAAALKTRALLEGYDFVNDQFVRARVTASGQGMSGITHKLAVSFSGDSIIGSVSGNMVSVSGQPVLVSGQLVAVSGTVAASVSGNMVSISGQPVSVSGNVVVASVTTNISGQTVYLVSGQNPTQLYALDLSGQQLMPLIVNASGSNILRVDAGSIQVSANVSGNVVYLVSGQNNVQMSGQVVLISGQTVVASVTTNISGQVVYLASGNNDVQISGQTVVTSVSVSGNQVGISGQVVYLVSGQNPVSNFGFIDSSGQLTQLRVTQSGQLISGIPHKLVVTFSGESIIGSVSGNMVSVSGQAVSVSGNIVNTSGQVSIISGQPVSVSGDMISISGQPISVSGNMISISGQPAKVSGETVSVSGIIEPRIPVQIRTRDTLLITGASGGIALLSGDVLRVTVRNIGVSGTVMYVGGSGDYPWVASGQANFPFQSGRGLWLRDGDGVTIHTSNMAFVRVVSHTSGEHVSYIGEQY